MSWQNYCIELWKKGGVEYWQSFRYIICGRSPSCAKDIAKLEFRGKLQAVYKKQHILKSNQIVF